MIQIEKIGTILIPLLRRITIKLYNIALAPKCNSNLISFGKICKSRITYHDNLMTMILMRNGKVIAKVKREQNLFILDLTNPKKAIAVISPPNKYHTIAMTGQECPTHLVSQNKCIWLWHRRLIHISNAHVLRIVKLVDGIKLDNGGEYNLIKMLINSDDSDVSELPNNEEPTIQSKVMIAVRQSIVTRNLNILDKLYTPYMGNKSTCVVR